jgi:hypothetical protein
MGDHDSYSDSLLVRIGRISFSTELDVAGVVVVDREKLREALAAGL